MLAELADPDKLVAFDRNRRVMAEEQDDPRRSTSLVLLADLDARHLAGREDALNGPPEDLLAPPDGPRGSGGKVVDPLAWYALG